MEIAQLLDLLINHGFFPFLKSDNPQAYPFILALLAISLAIGIAGTVRARIKGQLDLLPLLFVALDFAFLAVIWLTLSGSYEQFATIPPPAAGTSWLFLPAATVYVAGAVLLHSLVALAAGLALILVWITQQLRLPNGSRAAAAFGQTSLIVGTLLMVLNWNVANIPAWFLVVAEYPLALLVAVLSSELLALPLGRYSVRDPDAMRFVERAKGFVRTAAFATGVALIFWSHTEVAAPLILLGMYLQLTLLDNLVHNHAALSGIARGVS